jgi:hypothetical protein
MLPIRGSLGLIFGHRNNPAIRRKKLERSFDGGAVTQIRLR